jgi:hypothetical protein
MPFVNCVWAAWAVGLARGGSAIPPPSDSKSLDPEGFGFPPRAARAGDLLPGRSRTARLPLPREGAGLLARAGIITRKATIFY